MKKERSFTKIQIQKINTIMPMGLDRVCSDHHYHKSWGYVY